MAPRLGSLPSTNTRTTIITLELVRRSMLRQTVVEMTCFMVPTQNDQIGHNFSAGSLGHRERIGLVLTCILASLEDQ